MLRRHQQMRTELHLRAASRLPPVQLMHTREDLGCEKACKSQRHDVPHTWAERAHAAFIQMIAVIVRHHHRINRRQVRERDTGGASRLIVNIRT